MATVLLGILSAACWGVADFIAGLKARRMHVFLVLVVSQVAGLIAVGTVVVFSGDGPPAGRLILYAAIAGTVGNAALAAFYRGLAIGTMSIVAPISATGAALPVVVGIAQGERPGTIAVVGMVVAIVGVVLASREASDDHASAAVARRSVVFALIAAAGFGTFFVFIDKAVEGGVPWTLLITRMTTLSLMGMLLLALLASGRAGGIGRPARADVPALALVGILDVGANALYAYATTHGLLSIAAVCGSLYPLATVLLARLVLGERVRRIQEVGVVAALVGIALIAAS